MSGMRGVRRAPGRLAGGGATWVLIVLLLGLYAVAAGTDVGRRLDATALRAFQHGRLELPAEALMRWINPITLSAIALEAALGAVDPLGSEHQRALGAAFFPSGHATVAMALALAAAIALNSLVAAAGVAAAVGSGVAILLADAHLPSDVLAGFLLAGAWGAVVARALHDRERRRLADAVWIGRAACPLVALIAAATLIGALASVTTAALAAGAFAAMAVMRHSSGLMGHKSSDPQQPEALGTPDR